jgi:hypothetical protein
MRPPSVLYETRKVCHDNRQTKRHRVSEMGVGGERSALGVADAVPSAVRPYGKLIPQPITFYPQPHGIAALQI